MYYVYELRDLADVIVYIESSKDIYSRFYGHTHARGKFEGRKDLHPVIVREFENKKDALSFETSHKIANGFEPTEHNRSVSNGKRRGDENLTNEHWDNCHTLGRKKVVKISHTCPICSRIIYGNFLL